jgi:hypothetical protein
MVHYYKAFRFRSADERDLPCEPEDAARILATLKARLEGLVREGHGRLGEQGENFPPFQDLSLSKDLVSKEEASLKLLDVNSKVLRELKGKPGRVRLTYAVETGKSFARGLILVQIDLQEGLLDPSFKGHTGVLQFIFLERVSRQPIGKAGG